MGLRGPKSELVLFVDPNFWDNPKIAALSSAERDRWLRILAEQLRSRNGSELPFGEWGLSRKQVQRYVQAGLLETSEGKFSVHDWDDWNGTHAYKRFLTRERVRRLRERRGSEM